MRNFVIINGVNSNTINGLGINELPPITKPEMRNIREEIDGRDGDIITELGYSAYDKTITIGLFGTGYDINDIVAFFNGEGTIVFSNEADKYYKYKILNQIDYESLQKFRTASITFHCQPFKYPLSETPLEIEYDYIEQEAETLTLNNTGNALMKLDLKGNTSQSGTPTPTSPVAVNVVSGDNTITISNSDNTQSQTYPISLGTLELCKIGTYQDYFTKNSNGEWCKYNAIGKVVLDGTQTISSVNTSLTNTTRVQLNGALPENCRAYADNILSKSNRLSYNNNWSKDEEGFFFDDNQKNVVFRINKATIGTTQGQVNTWLGSNNLIMYYPLATPYLSLIEDNNLIEQLDNIQNAMSYEGQTNISQVNNDKAFIISAKALEDGTNEVIVNNIGNVYSKPLLALEGNGNVDIYLDNTQILKANVEDKMNIDIAQLEAYNPDTMTLLNRQVIGNYNSMTLQPGNNTIRIDGSLDKATITNYTRWL